MFYNYHAQVKKLIDGGHLTRWEIVENYHGIRPALVLYFDDHRPMPVRQHRWEEYFRIFKTKDL